VIPPSGSLWAPGAALGRLAAAQRLLGLLGHRHVLEDEGEAPARRDRRGEDVEEAAHRLRAALEAQGPLVQRHVGVRVDPRPLEARDELERRAPDRVGQARHLLEQRVRLEEAVVDRPALGVDDHLGQAVALVDRGEDLAQPGLALAQALLGEVALGDVEHRTDEAEVRPVVGEARRRGVDREAPGPVAAAQPVLDDERRLARVRVDEGRLGHGHVIGVDGLQPAEAEPLVARLAGERVPAVAQVRARPVGLGDPEHRGRAVDGQRSRQPFLPAGCHPREG
jgi:hypothetical protein